jgi:hypothetical protein
MEPTAKQKAQLKEEAEHLYALADNSGSFLSWNQYLSIRR